MKFLVGCDVKNDSLKIFDYDFKNNTYFINTINVEYISYIYNVNKTVYALTDLNFKNSNTGGYLNIITGDKVKKIMLNSENPCHIVKYKTDFFISNCSSNFINVYNIKKSISEKIPLNYNSNTHFTHFSKYGLLIIDSMRNQLLVYNKSKIVMLYQFKMNDFPRQFCMHDKILYVICEKSCNLYSLELKNNCVKLVNVQNFKFDKNSTGCVIKSINKNILMCTIRGSNKILIFNVKNKIPVLIGTYDSEGNCPKDFIVKGKILLVVNEKSNSISIFKIEDGYKLKLINKIENITSPTCISFYG